MGDLIDEIDGLVPTMPPVQIARPIACQRVDTMFCDDSSITELSADGTFLGCRIATSFIHQAYVHRILHSEQIDSMPPGLEAEDRIVMIRRGVISPLEHVTSDLYSLFVGKTTRVLQRIERKVLNKEAQTGYIIGGSTQPKYKEADKMSHQELVQIFSEYTDEEEKIYMIISRYVQGKVKYYQLEFIITNEVNEDGMKVTKAHVNQLGSTLYSLGDGKALLPEHKGPFRKIITQNPGRVATNSDVVVVPNGSMTDDDYFWEYYTMHDTGSRIIVAMRQPNTSLYVGVVVDTAGTDGAYHVDSEYKYEGHFKCPPLEILYHRHDRHDTTGTFESIKYPGVFLAADGRHFTTVAAKHRGKVGTHDLIKTLPYSESTESGKEKFSGKKANSTTSDLKAARQSKNTASGGVKALVTSLHTCTDTSATDGDVISEFTTLSVSSTCNTVMREKCYLQRQDCLHDSTSY